GPEPVSQQPHREDPSRWAVRRIRGSGARGRDRITEQRDERNGHEQGREQTRSPNRSPPAAEGPGERLGDQVQLDSDYIRPAQPEFQFGTSEYFSGAVPNLAKSALLDLNLEAVIRAADLDVPRPDADSVV